MDMQKQDEVKYYKWIEPTLLIRKSLNDQTSYILYNRISNFKINGNDFKMVTIDIPNHKSEYISYITDYRLEYSKYLKNLYPDSYSTDSGFSAMIDAIKSINENLIILYKNYSIIGAISYDINDKRRDIIISHIGVLERRKGHGTLLMKDIFSLADIIKFSVTVTSNGYADDFYHSLGMLRLVDKPLGIYSIQANKIRSMT